MLIVALIWGRHKLGHFWNDHLEMWRQVVDSSSSALKGQDFERTPFCFLLTFSANKIHLIVSRMEIDKINFSRSRIWSSAAPYHRLRYANAVLVIFLQFIAFIRNMIASYLPRKSRSSVPLKTINHKLKIFVLINRR